MAKASSAAKTCAASRSASENTATEPIPISRRVRKTRIAISPRFATRTFRIVRAGVMGVGRCPSERDVAVLLGGQRLALVREHAERADQAGTGLLRLDHVVQVAEPGGDIGVRELLVVLVDQLGPRFGRILGRVDLLPVDD